MHVLFANTGVQLLCVPLVPGDRPPAEAVGRGWQYFDVETAPGQVKRLPYAQWQILEGQAAPTRKLFLAVDTTSGPTQDGYVCAPEALDQDVTIPLDPSRLLGPSGRPLGLRTPVRAVIRPVGAGDPKDVHLVVDVGNSRTGALLLETGGPALSNPPLPFTLLNRYHLDAWNDSGEPLRGGPGRWFPSRTSWCTPPYRDPPPVVRVLYRTDQGGLFSKRTVPYESAVTPQVFLDHSMARLGAEAEDITLVMNTGGDLRTGLSSPKRYLWAADSSWLEGADWQMADPYDRLGTGRRAARLQGKLLRYLPEDDRDDLITKDRPGEDDRAEESPVRPRHAPRVLMTAALYELLCQAYTAVNSAEYRLAAGDEARPRLLRSLTLTYPSGMTAEERARLELQARKAARIFHRTLGRQQPHEPHVTLEIDEASAVHITYIWSELQMTGLDPGLWFSLVGRDPEPPSQEAPAAAAPPPEPAEPAPAPAAAAARDRRKFSTPGGSGDRNEVRIACIDIGGGTTDFMIARYVFRRGVSASVEGEILQRDGISVAGDQLVKRLLERVVAPAFVSAVGLDGTTAKLLFGPQVPRNLEFRTERIGWMNRLFVPLAQRYLDNAVTDDPAPISHTDPDVVSDDALGSLEKVLTRLTGETGYYALREPMSLVYDRAVLESIVHEVFHTLLFDYCGRIVRGGGDIVLLAGQPTKLEAVQQLVRLYLPLHPSRIIPMYKHYAGNWYPYQDERGRDPGVIADPKSAVVVGAAIHFLAQYGMLRPVRFSIRDPVRQQAYFWGVVNDASGRFAHLLFEPSNRAPAVEFQVHVRHVLIGRRLGDRDGGQASPVYALKVDPGDRLGKIDVKVKLRRVPPSAGRPEESLELESAVGSVAGLEAVPGENVRLSYQTLSDERYYLDTGGLDNILIDG
jgi:hypothetical protein